MGAAQRLLGRCAPSATRPPAASVDLLRPNRRLRLQRGIPGVLSQDCLHRRDRPIEPVMDPTYRPCQRSGSPARTRRKDDHGRVPIRLRIAHRREKRFISLPVKALLGNWNGDKRRVTGTHPDAGEINALLSDLERVAFSVISRLQRVGYRPLRPSGSRAKLRGEREEGKAPRRTSWRLPARKLKATSGATRSAPSGPTGPRAASLRPSSKRPTGGRRCPLGRSKRSCFGSFGPTATRSGAAVRTLPSADCLSCARSCATP